MHYNRLHYANLSMHTKTTKYYLETMLSSHIQHGVMIILPLKQDIKYLISWLHDAILIKGKRFSG